MATSIGLGLLFVAFIALVILDRQTGTLRGGTTPSTITWLAIAFVGFLVAVWGNERRPLSSSWIWGTAIVFRLLMLTTEPTLSDDVFRYLWDGHLLTEGVNPYSYPISSTALDPFEVEVRRLANNPHLASPYLPTAQLLFGLAATIAPLKAFGIQAMMALFDLGTAVMLVHLLRNVGFATHRVGLYLWHPLVIVELSHGAHLDSAMTFFAVAALAATAKNTTNQSAKTDRDGQPKRWLQVASPLLLALAVLTRPLPLLLVPILWWRWRWWQRALFGASTIGLFIPFSFGQGGLGLDSPSVGTGLFGSARVYASDFRFNAGLAHWMEDLFGQASSIPTIIVATIMAKVGLIVWLLAKPTQRSVASPTVRTGNVELVRQLRLCAVPLMAYTLLTPVFHPWYLIILLAFLPFLAPGIGESMKRWMFLAPWLTLSALLPLSYLTYQDPNRFAEREWVRLTEWLPTLALVVVAALVSYRGRSVLAVNRRPD